MSVQENGEAVFICNVVSNPLATVTWFAEVGTTRQLLTPGPRIDISNNILIISNVQQSDVGFYTCVATNVFGSNTTTARLVIAGKITDTVARNVKHGLPQLCVTLSASF